MTKDGQGSEALVNPLGTINWQDSLSRDPKLLQTLTKRSEELNELIKNDDSSMRGHVMQAEKNEVDRKIRILQGIDLKTPTKDPQ